MPEPVDPLFNAIEEAARDHYERGIAEPWTPGHGELPSYDDVPDDRYEAQKLGTYGDASWNRKMSARELAEQFVGVAVASGTLVPASDQEELIELLRQALVELQRDPHVTKAERAISDALALLGSDREGVSHA